ncbi:hypothetical protein [Stenotrophomonas maltophilia]|nr:hypothetical protein [Stenotrophomonas maltophilia]
MGSSIRSQGDVSIVATAGDLNSAMSAVDLRKMRERAEVMQLGGQLLFKGGDLGGYLSQKAETEEGKAFWADGGNGRALLHGMVGAAMAALGGADALKGAVSAAGAEKAKIAISEFLESNTGSLSWEDYQSLMEVGSAMVGGALGGSTGANIAVTGDRFNRQLHISEIDLIQGSASGFAQRLCGCRNPSREQIDAAEKSLSEQAYRQVQFGVEGQWDRAASGYLRQVSAGRLLEPDPNRPGSGYSPLFYATPAEKADATQYVGSWNLRADFYRKNGLDVPSQEQAMAAAIQDQIDRKTHGKVLIGGTAVITAAGLSPVALAAARGCLSKPASCDAILTGVVDAVASEATGGASLVVGAGAAAKTAELIVENVAREGASGGALSDMGRSIPQLPKSGGPKLNPGAGTANFADEAKLMGHFEKHGGEFGAKSASEYLEVGKDIVPGS